MDIKQHATEQQFSRVVEKQFSWVIEKIKRKKHTWKQSGNRKPMVESVGCSKGGSERDILSNTSLPPE